MRRYWLAAIMCCAATPPLEAAIISTTGSVQVVSPPASVALDVYQSNDVVRVFQEQGPQYEVPSDIFAFIYNPGTYSGNWFALTPPGPAKLVAGVGELVESYFFHFDPVTTTGLTRTGSVTFDQEIKGVLAYFGRIRGSDVPLGNPGTAYGHGGPPVPQTWGLETVFDQLVISPDRKTITYSVRATTDRDQFRVITATTTPVPEPTSLAVMGGLGLVAWLGRRRRQKS